MTLKQFQKEFIEALDKADSPAKRLEIVNAYELKCVQHGYQHLVWDEDSQSWKP
jgi:hypothetical protein